MATRIKNGVDAGSQNVVAVVARALLEQQNFPEAVTSLKIVGRDETAGQGTDITKSLMPDRIALNGRAQEFTVDGLREPVVDANAAKRVVTMQNWPTADSVMRNSFKIGCKLLIKIEPTAKSTKLPHAVPQMIFDKFSLQGIAESDSERYQLHETFEDNVLFLFGRRPRIWTMQGIVLNGRRAPDFKDIKGVGPESPEAREERLLYDQDWANRLLMDWDLYYRGSKAVEARARTYLAYDDTVIEATLLELVVSRNAQMPTAANASLTFALHERVFVGQEYVDGVTPANLKDLIDKTNAVGGFDKTVKPSEITPADRELAEIDREQLAAEAELKTAQAEENRAATEAKAIADATAQAKKDQAAAEARAAVAGKEILLAQEKLLAYPDDKDGKQREALATREKEIAEKDVEGNRQYGQFLDDIAKNSNEALNDAVAKEGDATAKRDVLAATADQTRQWWESHPVPTESEARAIVEKKIQTENEESNLIDFAYGGGIVTYTYHDATTGLYPTVSESLWL